MNKILLVQQYLGVNHEVGPVFPIGLAYIATDISSKTNWQVEAIDMNVYDDPYLALYKTLKTYNPDVVGLSVRNIDNVDYEDFNYFYKELDQVVKIIKQHCKVLLLGGAGFSIFAPEIMNQHRGVDYGIVQEGEETIVELLQYLDRGKSVEYVKGLYYWNGNTLNFTGERKPINFSKSKIPVRTFFEIEKYNKPLCMGVQTKRGCSLKCSYCTYPFLNKHTERFRTPTSVVDEIEQLVANYGIKEIIFCDDIFNNPLNHSIEIINGIIERDIKVKWSAWFDVGSTDKDFMRLAIKSGCYRFCFSTEGVIDSSLNKLQKNFSAKQADELIKCCLSKEFSDIDFRFSLFAMPPGQTIKGMIKTLYIVYKTHVSKVNSKCLVSWIRILPNTALNNKIGKSAKELLPLEVTPQSKDDLFYKHPTANKHIVILYKLAINGILSLRPIRKYFWRNFHV